MRHDVPITREVVLIGGGHTHALVLRRWGMSPLAGARVTLINPEPTAPYTGMLPGHVAGHYPRDALDIDLVRLARFAGARVIFGRASGLDRDAKLVRIEGRPDVYYDVASLDIGITSDLPDLPGFSEHAIPAKPLGPFADRWRRFLQDRTGRKITILGGGVGGIELALAMAHAMRQAEGEPEITVIERDRALAGVAAASRGRLIEELRRYGVRLLEGTEVTRIGATSVELADGALLESDLVVGAAGARSYGWLGDTGLTLTEGYVAVDDTLRSLNDPAIFAVGDNAHLSHDPRPKAGVFAVRAAPILFDNLVAAMTGAPLRAFKPQRSYLKLISLGRKSAIADRGRWSVAGDWAWRWKDAIDRRFMRRLSELPDMRPTDLPRRRADGVDEASGGKPLCGGCGAKVGGDILASVLSDLSAAAGVVASGPDDDAAVIDIGGTRQVITTDHLRAFWADPALMARIAAVHALGDIWAMGAHPQAALAQITLPRLADRLQERWLTEIMAAADPIFRDEGAAIVGGHTTMGAELQIGFAITGRLDGGRPIRISGGVAGDALLLTRPLGSGTIMAAEMSLDARGVDVEGALTMMSTPQGDIAKRLGPLVHAMTDVTGFGLAGHLSRLAAASGLAAEIDLSRVPILSGALELAALGQRSSIYPANRRAVSGHFPEGPLAALLFDPQTSGGFLAALPPVAAEEAANEIENSSIIGRLVEGTPGMVSAA